MMFSTLKMDWDLRHLGLQAATALRRLLRLRFVHSWAVDRVNQMRMDGSQSVMHLQLNPPHETQLNIMLKK